MIFSVFFEDLTGVMVRRCMLFVYSLWFAIKIGGNEEGLRILMWLGRG